MSSIEWIGASQVMRSSYGRERLARRLVLEVGVLEPGVRERLGDPRVERRVGLDVDGRALVGALEVDRVDGAGLDEPGDQLVVPVGRAVELEAQVRVGGQPARDRLERRRVAHARGDDERDRARLAARARRPASAPAWRSARSSAALSNAQRR